MNLILQRTDSANPAFITLTRELDEDLAVKDGDDHPFYAQFNQIDSIKYVVIAYEDGNPAGCGALKEFSSDTMEVKRMYTRPGNRGKGIATAILNELEKWAGEMGYKKCVLETGKRQPDAIRLYEKNDYQHIENYGPYVGKENSVCFEKTLT